MENLIFSFPYDDTEYQFEMVFVPGSSAASPFMFGGPGEEQAIAVPDFFIAATQTTQALWQSVMQGDNNRFLYKGDLQPAEHVSWYETRDFLEKLNQQFGDKGTFRLPAETEWEYAARGGAHWQDGFQFAGRDDMMASGWYEGNAGPYTDMAVITPLKNQAKLTTTHPVGHKQPNQLGLYDMNGNVWEWCQDWFVRDTGLIPKDGSAYTVATGSKVLRGGCHHNGAVHCRNTMRYEIPPDSFDGCIGFRMALTAQKT